MASENIEEIEGIGPAFAQRLRGAEIRTIGQLLEKGRTPRGREEIVQRTGLSPKRVLQWVNLADLFRIRGVGSEYAELLEAAGVDTVKELKHRNAENLAVELVEVNAERQLTRQTPSSKVVEGWIAEAATLPAGVEY